QHQQRSDKYCELHVEIIAGQEGRRAGGQEFKAGRLEGREGRRLEGRRFKGWPRTVPAFQPSAFPAFLPFCLSAFLPCHRPITPRPPRARASAGGRSARCAIAATSSRG